MAIRHRLALAMADTRNEFGGDAAVCCILIGHEPRQSPDGLGVRGINGA
jgi:hypothetical protein